MLDPKLESELRHELDQLPVQEQQKVLAYARDLVAAANVRTIDLSDFGRQKFDAMLAFVLAQYGFQRLPTGPFFKDKDVDLRVVDSDERLFLVQCKPWTELSIGIRALRVLSTIIQREKATGGFIVTSGNFTTHAARLAKQNQIVLIDGEKLLKLLSKFQQDDQGRPVRFIISRRREEKAREESGDVRGCPLCGGPMIRRTLRSGTYAGQTFRVCGRFPRCRGRRRVSNP